MLQHEKYLNRFVTLFKTVDSDNDGIINEEQFKALIREMKIIPNTDEQGEIEIEKLLIMIDPHKTQQITFSELVTFLTLTELNDSTPNRDLGGATEEATSNLLESFTNYNDDNKPTDE
jgi:Ca2+-binding EF-hand superfamily protein